MTGKVNCICASELNINTGFVWDFVCRYTEYSKGETWRTTYDS